MLDTWPDVANSNLKVYAYEAPSSLSTRMVLGVIHCRKLFAKSALLKGARSDIHVPCDRRRRCHLVFGRVSFVDLDDRL